MKEFVALFDSFDLPGVILIVLLTGFVYTLWRISRGDRVFLADMLKGENGLASAGRFIALGGWIFATWALMVVILKYVRGSENAPFPNEYALGYLAICITGYAANKFSESWRARSGQPEEDKTP